MDPHDPTVNFNVRKYYEYTHDMHPAPGEEKLSRKMLQTRLEEQEQQTMSAIKNPTLASNSSTLSLLNIMLSELNDRQTKGLLNKNNTSAQSKNALALKFLDLHANVKNNQRLANIDTL